MCVVNRSSAARYESIRSKMINGVECNTHPHGCECGAFVDKGTTLKLMIRECRFLATQTHAQTCAVCTACHSNEYIYCIPRKFHFISSEIQLKPYDLLLFFEP